MQFPPPQFSLNVRIVSTPRDKSRLKPLVLKSLRHTMTVANRVSKRHRVSRRVRWVLPKALLMSRKPIAISLSSSLPGTTSQTRCEQP